MRLIDADAFDERVRVAGGMSEEELTEDFKDGVQVVLYMLSNQPTIQPEIIRCKDCKYWDTTWQNDYAPNYHYCPMIDGTRRNDFYCADAERRTDG